MSPDYVFCHEKVYDNLLIQLKKTIITFYSEDPEKSSDLCRLISEQHCQRMERLVSKCAAQGKIYFGGVVDSQKKYCSPTIVTDITVDSDIMKEEIFGPILPVMKYSNIDTVIDTLLNTPELENPLALYIFSRNKKFNDHIINRVPSGAAVVNDSIFHVANLNIPFGGRGTSGMGQYHGKFSFETFSHLKSVLRRDDSKLLDLSIRYPPYTETGFKIFKLAFAIPDLPAVTKFQFSAAIVACAIAGVLIGLGVTGRLK